MKQDMFESLDVIKIKRTAFEIVFYEDFEGTKGVIRIRKSKKNRQHTDQKKKYKRTNNDLQNIKHKTEDRVTQTPLNLTNKNENRLIIYLTFHI
jgi:tRNA A-37 threonylcarbamoyl transferase component Bud32